MSDAVLFEKRGDHIAVVTLNRPEKRNAVNADVTQGLDAALQRVESDPEIWIAILTSSNDRVFCAGADLAEVSRGNTAGMFTQAGGFAGFVNFPRTKPWIAAPMGATVAGGLELCLACDMIVAADTCTFGLPEVKRGLLAAAGGPVRLAKRIPLGIAMELLATGDSIDAQRAHALGLVNRVVPVTETLKAAIDFAQQINVNAPVPVREVIRLAREAQTLSDEDGRRLMDAASARVLATEDSKEGPLAFVEKRPPRWKGH